ncbi:MAG: ORF6N domain-containing protein [Patescibacteria group bacterium]
MEENFQTFVPEERIESKIYLIRGKKVILDRDLAALYCVTTGALNQAVKRNVERFPDDFMFKLSLNEASNLISQIVTSSFKSHKTRSRSQIVILNRGENIKYVPYAFTELGVAMLSSILRSPQAIAVNIQIMRTFAKLREILANHESLRLKLEEMEKRYDEQFRSVFDALRRLIAEDEEQKPEIGFHG